MALDSLAPSHDPLQYLPNEICLSILESLDASSLTSVFRVNRRWSSFASTNSVWKSLYRHELWLSTADTAKMLILTPTSSGMSWRSIFAARRRLESNWEAGQYSHFALSAGCNLSAIRLIGQHLFTGDITGTILRWDLVSRKLLLPPLLSSEEQRSEVRCIETDPHDPTNILVCGYRSGALVIWHIPTGNILQQHERAHEASVEIVRLSQRFVVTSSADNTIKVWARPSGGVGVSACSSSSIFHSSSCSLAISSAWTQPLTPTRTLLGNTAFISALHLSTSDILICSSPGDRTIKTWDLRTGDCKVTETCPGSVALVHLDGQRVSVVGKCMEVYDERQRRPVAVVCNVGGPTIAACAVYRGEQLEKLVTVGSGRCTVWKEVGGAWLEQHQLHEASAYCQPSGRRGLVKPPALRCCQVDERMIVCCAGARVLVWGFA